MTTNKAKKISQQLKNKKIGKWLIGDYINNGKSALVCKCFFAKKTYAIKIFDKELVEEFGEDDIKMRVERQIQIKDKHHPNLVKIFDGGKCSNTGFYFIIMEFLDQPNLSQEIVRIPRDRIKAIIKQLVKAVLFLQKHKIYHRDIKPDNISISTDYKKVILLDLGVIKPMIPDNDSSYQKKFLGTLQYSPIEYFLATVDDAEGWKAVTYYQIGAVLYDLIERKQMFAEYKHQWGRLSHAVLTIEPEFSAVDVPAELIHLAKKCLIKDKSLRLKIVKWDDFKFRTNEQNNIGEIKKRIQDLTEMKREMKNIENVDLEKNLHKLQKSFENVFMKVCKGNKNVPPFLLQPLLSKQVLEMLVSFDSSEDFALYHPLSIRYRFRILEQIKPVVEIDCAAILADVFPSYEKPKLYSIIYNDVFDEAKFETVFEKSFYSIYDKAIGITGKLVKNIEINLKEKI